MAEPAPTPLTTPVALTLAIAALLVDQVPPGAASASVMVAPVQTEEGPVTEPAVGAGLTVTLYVVKALAQVVLTV